MFLAGQRQVAATWVQNTRDNHAFDASFTPFVLVLSEVVLVLLLEIDRETFGSSTSRSAVAQDWWTPAETLEFP